jgi:hypothetical protein
LSARMMLVARGVMLVIVTSCDCGADSLTYVRVHACGEVWQLHRGQDCVSYVT